ncbi:hypothetical protein L6Q96_08785 [Candidatus Binatia bacterium]|nr:hypothetical protein [Candidatus Binatia bacterium]
MKPRFETVRWIVATTLGLSLTAVSTWAGIADSPLPVLEAGKTTHHVYSVPGVQQNGALGTFFSCTSTDTATMQVSVEGFGSAGGGPETDAVANSLAVAPGATVTFATQSAVGIGVNMIIGFTSARGSARILATSKKLACTAFVADRSNDPATTSWQLNIIKKKTQKGD